MSIIRKVFTILLGVTLMFMNISGVKAQNDNTTTDFSNYITAASLDYKEGDKEIAYATDAKLTENTNLIFKLDADVPSSALSSDHKIDYRLPDNLNVDDTTSDHIYLKDDLTKSVGNYTIADHHMVIDLSALDYGVDSSKSIELDLETTTSHLIFTDSEAKIYFRKATNESPTEVMVSVLQNYANDTKADPNSIIKNTNTYTNTKKSSKQVIAMSGVKRVNSNVKARAGETEDGYTEISGNINEKAINGLSGKYRLTGETTADERMGSVINIKHDVMIDLNGQKLQLYDKLFFDIQPGGHLTILDSASKNYTPKSKETTSNVGNLSVLTKDTQNDPDKREVPVKLDYYVTHAEANGTKTTDTTTKYEVDLSNAGRIYTETSSTPGQDSTFMIEKGGTLDFNSGVAYNTGPHVVSTQGTNDLSNKATLNLSGGYLIGNQAGNVIYNNAGNTLNISGGVITNGKAQIGAGIYNDGLNNGTSNGGTINLTGGIITGNEVERDATDLDHDKGRYSGAGIYMKSGTLNISGNAYITNNRKSEGSSSATHFSVHGGGGVAADNDSQVNMSGGYVTGNYSNEAGGGLYIGYYTQSGNAKLTLTGGTIASNVAQTGEGGGIRIGGAGRGTIRAASKNHPIYITNNKTNTGDNNNQTGDWGGGGIFVQQNGQLYLMNVIITANTADGFGAGLSACPTGNTAIATDQGAAIYGNTAKGVHYSRGSGTKNEDKDAYEFYQKNNRTDYQDYFLAHDQNTPAYNVTNGMLGGGSEEYEGTFNNNNSYEEVYNSSKFIGLSAHPSDEDVKTALGLASTYISGNYSHNHGGGIMTNGIVTLGESHEVFPSLKLNAYKAFQLKAAAGSEVKDLPMNTNQFKFKIFQHTGSETTQPQWDGTKFTATSGTNNLVSEFGNEDAAAGSLGKIESNIPNFLYNEAGSYTFYLVEEDNEDKMITYDHSVYVMHFDVKEDGTTTVNNVKITKYAIKDLSVTKVVNGTPTKLDTNDYSYNTDDSLVTLYSSEKATFTNTEQSYDLSLTKIDQDKTERKLSGAEFTLYQLASNYHDKSVNTIDISQYATQTTDKDGIAVFQSLQRDHLYYLKETKAPQQYETSGPWIIEITDSGSAKIYDADCTESDDLKTLTRNSSKTFMKGEGTDLTNTDNVFKTTISDPSIKYTMPNTGGHGTRFYYQVGILLITLVNIVWIIKRRVV